MLIFDLKVIGEKFYQIRTQKLMSRLDVAEAAGLSDRTYADIERGAVNMRLETILRICQALHITPDDVLTEEAPSRQHRQGELWARLSSCSPQHQDTAMELLSVYLDSL